MKKLLIFLILIALIFPVVMAETISELSESVVEWKQVTDKGVSESLSPALVKTKQSPTTMRFSVSNGKSKMMQVNPHSSVLISQDGKIVTQLSKDPNSPLFESHYGYQDTEEIPWTQYYKIEKCDATQCRVVRAEFSTRKVWIEYIPIATANSITGIIPYNELPSGVAL